MTRQQSIDGLLRLISRDCTETQWDYVDEIKFAIMVMTKDAIKPCDWCQEFACDGCEYAELK